MSLQNILQFYRPLYLTWYETPHTVSLELFCHESFPENVFLNAHCQSKMLPTFNANFPNDIPTCLINLILEYCRGDILCSIKPHLEKVNAEFEAQFFEMVVNHLYLHCGHFLMYDVWGEKNICLRINNIIGQWSVAESMDDFLLEFTIEGVKLKDGHIFSFVQLYKNQIRCSKSWDFFFPRRLRFNQNGWYWT